MWKSSVRICIGVGVILGGLLAFGIGSIFWKSYTIKRNPVYQTRMTDFEFQRVTMNDKEYAAHVTSELNKLTEAHGIKKLKCFIFYQNPNRTVYRIIMVGNLQKTADLSEYITNEYQLKDDDIPLSSALELCGVSPQKNEVFTQACVLPNGGAYIYKNHFIFDRNVLNKKYLKNDEEMKAFLEKIIRHRSENK